MALSNTNKKRVSYISVPSQIINSLSSSSLQSLLVSPKKPSKSINRFTYKNPRIWFFTLFLVSLFGMFKLDPFSHYPCPSFDGQLITQSHLGLLQKPILNPINQSNGGKNKTLKEGEQNSHLGLVQNDESHLGLVQKPILNEMNQLNSGKDETLLKEDEQKSHLGLVQNSESDLGLVKKPILNGKNETLIKEGEFWKQPNGLGFKPCLGFTSQYRKDSNSILKNRWKYLLVVVSGGMNQQRNQIVDAVVIARILGASLVVPVLQVNVIWGDESEFADIFDLEHFKNVLADDVHIVSSLPSTHVMTRPVEEKRTPLHASPQWIRAHYLKRINRERVLLLRGLDSRLSKDLPSDLQKLRCKVAFQALRFSPRILELGNKLAARMRNQGQYLSLHLRMEKDVWVRTGCLPGLTPEYDEIVNSERERHPELLTGRSNMTYHQRKLAGLCPLTALEVARLLKALEAPKDARIYWAGGEPLGGKEALEPLTKEFPQFYNKHDLALPGELEPFARKASVMAAIDYIVCEKSDVFIPSHGGNMGHALQGQRAYAGHKKYITPNKRQMLPYFMNSSLSESDFNSIVKDLHRESLGQPELRLSKAGKDVTKHPVPECMCSDRQQQQEPDA